MALLLVAATAPSAAAYPRPGQTERVSVASDGTQGDGPSYRTSISGDGRYVAFASDASNLVPGDTNGATDVFVRDRLTGSVERVSVATDGTQGNSWSRDPSISADGRYVAFRSLASTLVPFDTNERIDIFVHDRQARVTEVVSVGYTGALGNGSSYHPSISADGRHVAFYSLASNLVPGDTNFMLDVFVKDRQTGAIERVSEGSNGEQANLPAHGAAISADGRYVAFYSQATSLAPGITGTRYDVFVHDRAEGRTERVSLAADGAQGTGESRNPSISADGRYVAFESAASNLVPGDGNATWDVFVRDRERESIERVSVASNGVEGNGESLYPAVSADGRHIVFQSMASNLVPGGVSGSVHIFAHDRVTRATELVSVGSDGVPANGGSPCRAEFPADWQAAPSCAVSSDGRHVAFQSAGSNLAPGDTNQVFDMFVRDRGPAAGVVRISAAPVDDGVSVSGAATFSGVVLSSASAGEGLPIAGPLGADLDAASLIYRPENEDLLVRLRLVSLPPPLTPGGTPGRPAVVYGLRFDAAGTSYEVRARGLGATAGPHFGLYRCEATCTEHAGLTGGLGTTGAEVLVSVPLSVLGAAEGAALSDIQAFIGLGSEASGSLASLDEADLPGATIPAVGVSVGIAPVDSPETEVDFVTEAVVESGSFSATVDASGFQPGAYDVWARACVGTTCGAKKVFI